MYQDIKESIRYVRRQPSAAAYYIFARRIWDLLLYSLPLDFVLAYLGLTLSFGVPTEYLILALLGLSWIFAWRFGIFSTISYLRNLKEDTRTAISQSKSKSVLAFIAIVVLGAMDIVLRVINGTHSYAPLVIMVVTVVALLAGYRGFREINEFKERAARDPSIAGNLINKENFVICIVPMVLLRAAALLTALTIINSTYTWLVPVLYAAVLLSFQTSMPEREDFFCTCRSCGALFPKTTANTERCGKCASQISARQLANVPKERDNNRVDRRAFRWR